MRRRTLARRRPARAYRQLALGGELKPPSVEKLGTDANRGRLGARSCRDARPAEGAYLDATHATAMVESCPECGTVLLVTGICNYCDA